MSVSYNSSRASFRSPYETQGAKIYWFEHWKAHAPFKKVTVKSYPETLQPAFSSGDKIFKVEKTL